MIHDVAYCLNCKKIFHENLVDVQGFICCRKCVGAHKFNVIQLTYDEDGKYSITLQDEFAISFHDKKDFNRLIRIFEKLMKLSRSIEK